MTLGLSKLARELLEETGGDIGTAKNRVEEFLAHERSRKIIAQFVMEAFMVALEDVWRRRRRVTTEATGPTGSPSLQRQYQDIAKGIYDWPLSFTKNLVLGDASADDIDEWVDRRRAQLETEMIDIEWLSQISSELKKSGKKTVRAWFKETDLAKMRVKVAEKVRSTAA